MAAPLSISIEVPVFKGAFLRPCIDSVLAQTSDAWTLSLVWDGGDAESRAILEALAREDHPRIRVHFTENRGIAAARRFLTDRGTDPWLLPLDDDDLLVPEAVARFLAFAADHPWASLIRARRDLIGVDGAPVDRGPLFPFGPRHYCRGMVTDPYNQAQPYLIRRSAYRRTQGWRGYADFKGAGEDCDIFLQLEEVAHFELLDEILYRYRVHDTRASEALTAAAGYEMWRRLLDDTLARIGLPLRRTSAMPPFLFEATPVADATLGDVDFVVPAPAGRAARSLRRCGIAECAIHAAGRAGEPGGWRMAGLPANGRRLVCFIEDSVGIAARGALERLVEAVNEGADLVAADPGDGRPGDAERRLPFSPPMVGEILLVRRALLAATGGFDAAWVPAALQGADLWIQARRRDFRCLALPAAGFSRHGPAKGAPSEADLAALGAKWRSHAETPAVDAGKGRATADAAPALRRAGARASRPGRARAGSGP